MARRLLPTMLDYTATVLGGRTLGFPRPRAEDVVEIVRRFHRDSALTVLLRLNLALTHTRPLVQADILRTWLDPETADRTLAVMREQGTDVLFHEGQVLNLIRLVILYSPADEGFRCERPQEFRLLTRALLMITDLMFPDERVTDLRATIFMNFTRSEIFRHDEQYVPNTMARNYDLFVMLPRLLPQRGGPFDVAGIFRALTGIEIEDYLGLGFGLLAHYDAIEPHALGNAAIGIQRATCLREVQLPPERRDGLWGIVSRPIAAYRAALQAEWDGRAEPARWASMLTFAESPMIEFPDGTVIAVSRRLLRDRVTHGIYWVIANALAGVDRDRFTERFGDVFEEYVRRCFLRALGRSFHPKPAYGLDRLPLVDGGLVMPRSLGLPRSARRAGSFSPSERSGARLTLNGLSRPV